MMEGKGRSARMYGAKDQQQYHIMQCNLMYGRYCYVTYEMSLFIKFFAPD